MDFSSKKCENLLIGRLLSKVVSALHMLRVPRFWPLLYLVSRLTKFPIGQTCTFMVNFVCTMAAIMDAVYVTSVSYVG